ncbi:MAG: flagellar protein FlhE [Rhodocyclaceae bacterium]|nr:flagellar protein FlhE [Rhodocyclaceae bacterium]
MKRHLFSIILAFAATALLAQNAHAVSGAYSVSAVVPRIYVPNEWYYSEFPVMDTPTKTATIDFVSYDWEFNYPRPAGLQLRICAGNYCYNVTNAATGYLDFRGLNVPITQPVRLYARIQGSVPGYSYGGSSLSNITVSYHF